MSVCLDVINASLFNIYNLKTTLFEYLASTFKFSSIDCWVGIFPTVQLSTLITFSAGTALLLFSLIQTYTYYFLLDKNTLRKPGLHIYKESLE